MRSFRLVHIGVSAALAAATVTAIGLVHAVGAVSGGTASVFVPITPCRLLDTRAGVDNVGARSTPLAATETATFAVWGTNGTCAIPTAATGIATNATAVNPTAASYMTIFPADANPRPTASNLNVVAGGAPTPNQVTVGLSAAGAISIYNNGGTVDMIIDIVGYYTATSGTGAQGPVGPQGPQGPQGLQGTAGTNGNDGAPGPTCPPTTGCVAVFHALEGYQTGANAIEPATGCFAGSSVLIALTVPVGAVISNVRVIYRDTDNFNAATFTVLKVTSPSTTATSDFAAGSSVDTQQTGFQSLDLTPLTTISPITNSGVMYNLRIQYAGFTGVLACQAQVTYHF